MFNKEELIAGSRVAKVARFIGYVSCFLAKRIIVIILLVIVVILCYHMISMQSDIQSLSETLDGCEKTIAKSGAFLHSGETVFEIKHLAERLDTMSAHQSDMITWVGIIAGVVVAGGGIFAPFLINRGYEKKFDQLDANTKLDLKEVRENYIEIKDVKDEILLLKKSVDNKEKKTDYNTNCTEIRNLISQAIKEDKDNIALELYNKAIELTSEFLKKYDLEESELKTLKHLKFSALVNIGGLHSRSNDNRTALLFLNQALDIKRGNVQAIENKAIILRKLRLSEEAIAEYEKIIEIDSAYESQILRKIADVYAEIKDFDTALQYYRKSKEIKIDSPEILNNYGVTLMENNQLDEAKKQFELALEIYPKDCEAYYNLGIMYQNAGAYQQALQYFDLAITRNINSYKSYIHRALCKMNTRDFIGAINDDNLAIRIDPNNPMAYVNKGKVLHSLNDYSGALNEYNFALLLDEKFWPAYINRSQLYTDLENYELSLKDLQKAEELQPNEVINIGRSSIYASQGDYQKSIHELDKISKFAENNIVIAYAKSSRFVKLKEWQKAIDELTRIVDTSPEKVKPLVERGKIYFKWEKYDESLRDLNEAVEKINKEQADDVQLFDVVEIYKYAGKLYFEMKDYLKALEYFNAIKELKINDIEIYKMKIECYKKLLNEKEISLNEEDKLNFEEKLNHEKIVLEVLGFINY